MFQIHHDVSMAIPYLWQCAAIDGAPGKSARRVRLECPMGTIDFWTDQRDLLEKLKVGDYYRFGVSPAYEVAAALS